MILNVNFCQAMVSDTDDLGTETASAGQRGALIQKSEAVATELGSHGTKVIVSEEGGIQWCNIDERLLVKFAIHSIEEFSTLEPEKRELLKRVLFFLDLLNNPTSSRNIAKFLLRKVTANISERELKEILRLGPGLLAEDPLKEYFKQKVRGNLFHNILSSLPLVVRSRLLFVSGTQDLDDDSLAYYSKFTKLAGFAGTLSGLTEVKDALHAVMNLTDAEKLKIYEVSQINSASYDFIKNLPPLVFEVIFYLAFDFSPKDLVNLKAIVGDFLERESSPRVYFSFISDTTQEEDISKLKSFLKRKSSPVAGFPFVSKKDQEKKFQKFFYTEFKPNITLYLEEEGFPKEKYCFMNDFEYRLSGGS